MFVNAPIIQELLLVWWATLKKKQILVKAYGLSLNLHIPNHSFHLIIPPKYHLSTNHSGRYPPQYQNQSNQPLPSPRHIIYQQATFVTANLLVIVALNGPLMTSLSASPSAHVSTCGLISELIDADVIMFVWEVQIGWRSSVCIV